MSPRKGSNRIGFTLIELLIVVAIIAILAAIAVPNFIEAQTRSKVSRAVADLRSLATGMESYYVDNNKYPPGFVDVMNPAESLILEYELIFPRVDRLKPITTPVSYLTTLPYDPFLIGSGDMRSTRTAPITPEDNFVFSYWTPAHADGHRQGGAFNTPQIFQDIPGEDTRFGRYLLTAAGPDLTVETPEHFIPGAILAVYDPTNGTTSPGEIWRFGP